VFAGSGSGSLFLGFTNNGAQIFLGRQGVAFDLSYDYTPLTAQWFHVAFVRSSGTLTLYINGQEKASSSTAQSYSTLSAPANLGFDGSSAFFVGYMDEFRVSDIARWTSDFTPPTAPYGEQASGGPGNPDTYTWFTTDVPLEGQLSRYLQNVQNIRDSLGLTSPLPADMATLNYIGANQIEQALLAVESCLQAMQAVFLRSGMTWATAGSPGFYFAN
jgi:hypothetical protein